MNGVWLTRSNGCLVTGTTQAVFNRDIAPTLKMKKKSKNGHPLFFVPVDKMLAPYLETYKDSIVEEPDELSAQVEDVLGDVTNLRRSAIHRPKLRASSSKAGEHKDEDANTAGASVRA